MLKNILNLHYIRSGRTAGVNPLRWSKIYPPKQKKSGPVGPDFFCLNPWINTQDFALK